MTTKGQRQQYTFSEIVDEEDSELLENYLTDVSTPEYPKYRRGPRCPKPSERKAARLCACALVRVLLSQELIGNVSTPEYPKCVRVPQCSFFCFRS